MSTKLSQTARRKDSTLLQQRDNQAKQNRKKSQCSAVSWVVCWLVFRVRQRRIQARVLFFELDSDAVVECNIVLILVLVCVKLNGRKNHTFEKY